MASNLNGVIELIASDLASKGLMVTPVRDSILHALTVSQAQSDVNEVVKKLSTVLNNELILIKNKILPFSQELKQEFDKILANSTLPNELAEYNIKEHTVPEATATLLKNKKDGVGEGSESIGENGISLPAPEQDIRSYFTPNDPLLKQELSVILDKYADEDLYKLWDKYLANISENNPNIAERGYDVTSKLEDYTLLIVALEKLQEEKLPNSGVPDDRYFLLVGLLLNELYAMIVNQFKTWDNFRKTGRMIFSINEKQAIVDSELYNKFLETGGSVEAVLGLLVTGKTDSASLHVNNIKEHIVEYEDIWKQKVKYNSFSALPRERDRYKTAYTVLALKIISDNLIPEDLKEHVNQEFTGKPEISLEFIEEEQLLDVDYVINKMVSKIFDSTYFGTFTNYMVSYSKLNQELTPQECATFAALDLIIDYILGSACITSPLGQDVVNV